MVGDLRVPLSAVYEAATHGRGLRARADRLEAKFQYAPALRAVIARRYDSFSEEARWLKTDHIKCSIF